MSWYCVLTFYFLLVYKYFLDLYSCENYMVFFLSFTLNSLFLNSFTKSDKQLNNSFTVLFSSIYFTFLSLETFQNGS